MGVGGFYAWFLFRRVRCFIFTRDSVGKKGKFYSGEVFSLYAWRVSCSSPWRAHCPGEGGIAHGGFRAKRHGVPISPVTPWEAGRAPSQNRRCIFAELPVDIVAPMYRPGRPS